MDRAGSIQKIKELTLSLKDLEDYPIFLIAKEAYGKDVTDLEIKNIIKNIKTSSENLETPLHITELIDVVDTTLSKYPGGDPWEEIQELGKGSYGTVYEMKADQTHFAFKELHESDITNSLVKEIASVAILNSVGAKNTPELVGFALASSGKPGIATELATTDLFDWIKTPKPLLFKRELPKIVDFLLESLGEIQSVGIIHGDIKPENMLLWINTNNEVTKAGLTDFGLASSFPNLGKVLYTTGYRAPEILNFPAKSPSSFSSIQTDCWAFAQSILNVCTGFSPYEIPSAKQEYLKYLREDQADLLTQMHNSKPENRCIKRVTTKVPKREYRNVTDKVWVRDLIEHMATICQSQNYRVETFIVAVDILFRSDTFDILTAIVAVILGQMWSDAFLVVVKTFLKKVPLEEIFQSEFEEDEINAHILEVLKRINGLVWIPGLDIEKFKNQFGIRPQGLGQMGLVYDNIKKYIRSSDPADLF